MNKKIIIPMLGLTSHGGNRVLIDLANELSINNDVLIITPLIDNDLPFQISEKVTIKKIATPFENKILIWLYFLLVNPFFIPDGDLIANHALTNIFSFFAKMNINRKRKCFFFIQGLEYEAYSNKIIKGFVKFITILGVRYSENIVTTKKLSDFVNQYSKRVYYFQLGISDIFFHKGVNVIKEYDAVYFLRHEEYKGLKFFDEIISDDSIKNYKILCLSQNVNLLNKYSKFSNVTCYKPVNDIELVGYIDKAKVCLYTSLYEGFGLPPLECMSRGVPSVLFDSIGPRVYCDQYNSIMLDEFDSEKMLYEWKQLLDDKVRLRVLSETAREDSEKYKLSSELKKLVTYIESVECTKIAL